MKFHINDVEYDMPNPFDLRILAVPNTIEIKTEIDAVVNDKEKEIFPMGKYRIVNIVHTLEKDWNNCTKCTHHIYLTKIK